MVDQAQASEPQAVSQTIQLAGWRIRRPRRSRRATRVASVVGFLLVWYLVARLELVSSLFLPGPDVVLSVGRQLWARGELQKHLIATLRRVIVGFSVGSAVGIGLGLLIGGNRVTRLTLRPLIELVRPLPGLAWVPLVLIWFGIGEVGKIYLIAYGVFFPVVTNTFDAVQSVDPQLIRAAASLGAGRFAIFWKVLFPATVPAILTGMTLGMGTAFSILVAAELVAATSGVGWMISDARRFFRTDIVLLGMIVIGVAGFVFVSGIGQLRKRLLRWHARERAR